jgi:hypothetical protein
MGVVVVQREGPHPDEAVEHATPLLDGMTEVAHGPRIDGHEVEFFKKPAPTQGFLKARIGLHGLLDLEDLLDRDHGAGILTKHLRQESAGRQVDLAGDNAHDAAPIDVEPSDALDGLARDIGAHKVFRRLCQIDRLDAEVLTPAVVVPDELCRAAEFGRR